MEQATYCEGERTFEANVVTIIDQDSKEEVLVEEMPPLPLERCTGEDDFLQLENTASKKTPTP